MTSKVEGNCRLCSCLNKHGIFEHAALECPLSLNGISPSCSACSQLASLEKELASTIQLAENLTRQLSQLRHSANETHSKMLKNLPTEIMARIFHDCIPEFGEPACRSMPFRLSSVCRAWRQITLSTPCLWNHLYIPLSFGHHRNLHWEQKVLLSDVISRSGALPLSIVVYTGFLAADKLDWTFQPHGWDFNPPAYSSRVDSRMHPIVEVLNAHAARWKVLHLRTPHHIIAQFNGKAPSPLLVEIEAIPRKLPAGDYELSMARTCFSEMQYFPSLKKVRLGRFEFQAIKFSWANISVVETKGFDILELFQLLREAPYLEDIKVHELFRPLDLANTALPPPSSIIVHDALLSIKIGRFADYEISQSFFHYLRCTCLKKLHVVGQGVLDNVLEFVESCSQTLTLLQIQRFRRIALSFVDLLRSMPNLEELLVYGVGFGLSDFVGIFVATSSFPTPPDSMHFLSRLTRLEIELPWWEHVEWRIIPSIFSSWSPNSNDISMGTDRTIGAAWKRPLKTVRIYVNLDAEDDDPEQRPCQWIPLDIIPTFEPLRDSNVLSVTNVEYDVDFIEQSKEILEERQLQNVNVDAIVEIGSEAHSSVA